MIEDPYHFDVLFDASHDPTQVLKLPGWTGEVEIFANLGPRSRVLRIPNVEYYTANRGLSCQVSNKGYQATGIRITPPCFVGPVIDLRGSIRRFTNIKSWVFKKDGTSGGSGQLIFHRDTSQRSIEDKGVLQGLIEPIPLFGRKADIRLFAVISSFDPPRIYLSRHGIVRVGSKNLTEPTNTHFQEVYHRDSISMTPLHASEQSPTYVVTLGHYWSTLRSHGVNVNSIWSKIKKMIALEFLLLGQNRFGCKTNKIPYRCGRATLFAVMDIIIDKAGEPFIMETMTSSHTFKVQSGNSTSWIFNNMEYRKALWGGVALQMSTLTEVSARVKFLEWLRDSDIIGKLDTIQKYSMEESINILADMAVEGRFSCHVNYENILPALAERNEFSQFFDLEDKLLYEIHRSYSPFHSFYKRSCVPFKF
jgi:hypothetical protein